MSNLPPDTTQGTVDRAAWDAEELPSPVAFGPLDVAAMQAVLDRLKATLSDDDRAAVSAVITVEPR